MEKLVDAIAEENTSILGSSPTTEDATRRGALCLTYLPLSPKERRGKNGRGAMALKHTIESFQEAVCALRKERSSVAELPYLWLDQAYQLRKYIEMQSDESGKRRSMGPLGLIARMLRPVLRLHGPRGAPRFSQNFGLWQR